MIQELKTYVCNHIPTDDDIKDAMQIVERDHIVIKLMWNVEYSGTYHVVIAHDSTLESVKEQMPTIYPV